MTGSFTYTDFFPYQSMREGQDSMMAAIEDAVRSKRNICCEAPNGFGKTCVTLSGVLPWLRENNARALYCARTHRQLDRVIEELDAMGEGRSLSGVSLRGRQHMCLNPFVLENADYVAPISEVCSHLKSSGKCAYYENTRNVDGKDLLEDLPKRVMSAPEIIKYAKTRKMCPYELAKKLVKVVDIVALSYLYVFDPFILSTFSADLGTDMSNVVLIQDEAHNVPTTALDSASDSLTISAIRQAMREATNYNDDDAKAFCKSLAKVILDLSTSLGHEGELIVDGKGVYNAALRGSGLEGISDSLMHMKKLGASIRNGLLKAGKFPRSFIFKVAEFMQRWLDISERTDYAFILRVSQTPGGTKRVSLDLTALDPTAVTQGILSLVRSSVAVSGTMSPLDAYSEMLGLGEDSVKVAFHSPFAAKNRVAIIVDGLDTSYQSRGEATYSRMVDHCVEVAGATPGNTGIFTTSYYIARKLLDAGLEERLDRDLYIEKQGARGPENDKMIEEFKNRGDEGGAVLLGVQGGRNSEGGDFPGAFMEGVIVVGVPYAKPTPSMDTLIAYFDKKFNGKGRDYAYVLPAMTRAIQAAGRPVRRLEDKGAIVFLDQRFATPYLRRFMPSWLDEVIKQVPDDPAQVAEEVRRLFGG
jgi:DNA excision repair protein ERCC-2